MVKRILLFCLLLSLSIVPGAWGASFTYTGSIAGPHWTGSSENPGGLISNDGWSDAELGWVVTSNDDQTVWTYTYTFTDYNTDYGDYSALKDLSHAIIEVSGNFTADNIFEGTTYYGTYPDAKDWLEGPKTFTEGEGNPGLPSSVWGLKWNTDGGGLDITDDYSKFSWTIVTDRNPMWGDFYAKDGKVADGTVEVWAYNTGFGEETDAEITDGNALGTNADNISWAWVLVPDTTTNGGGGGGDPIPEPTTMLLLGIGIVGLGVGLRKRFVK